MVTYNKYTENNPLTLKELKEMEPDTIFATGLIENSPEGIYMTIYREGDLLRYVAIRGGYHDWAIYVHWAENDISYITTAGQKVSSLNNVRKIIFADEEALNMYRF